MSNQGCSIDFVPKVFVALRPPAHVHFEGDYRLSQDIAKINSTLIGRRTCRCKRYAMHSRKPI